MAAARGRQPGKASMSERGKTGGKNRWQLGPDSGKNQPGSGQGDTRNSLQLGTGTTKNQPGNRWQLGLGTGDAESVLAEARRALFVMVGFLVILWIVQIANWADHYQLTVEYGIIPHDVGRLPEIFTAPFLHFSWAHIEGNSGPLFIFGFLAAYRGVRKFLAVTVFVAITSGLAAWIFESPNSLGAGASGVVFGYFGYIIVRGLFDRHLIDLMLGLVMALCFAYQFSVLLPQQGIGYQAHIGGVVGGIAAGWLFRDRGPSAPRGKKPGGTDPAGPRADLHQELRDLGL
jgi:membrane associated rhomboid family serine protease